MSSPDGVRSKKKGVLSRVSRKVQSVFFRGGKRKPEERKSPDEPIHEVPSIFTTATTFVETESIHPTISLHTENVTKSVHDEPPEEDVEPYQSKQQSSPIAFNSTSSITSMTSFATHRAAMMRARSGSNVDIESTAARLETVRNITTDAPAGERPNQVEVSKPVTITTAAAVDRPNQIEVGTRVIVTTDVLLLEKSIKAAGMPWPTGPAGRPWTRILGASGIVIKAGKEADIGDLLVELSDDIGWVPIASLEIIASCKRPDAAPSIINEKVPIQIVKDLSGDSESKLLPQINPEVTPEVSDDEQRARSKSKIKIASPVLKEFETRRPPKVSRVSFFDDLEDSDAEDIANAGTPNTLRIPGVKRLSQTSLVSQISGEPDAQRSTQQSPELCPLPDVRPRTSSGQSSLFDDDTAMTSRMSVFSDDSDEPSLAQQDRQQEQADNNSQSVFECIPQLDERRRSQGSLFVNDSLESPAVLDATPQVCGSNQVAIGHASEPLKMLPEQKARKASKAKKQPKAKASRPRRPSQESNPQAGKRASSGKAKPAAKPKRRSSNLFSPPPRQEPEKQKLISNVASLASLAPEAEEGDIQRRVSAMTSLFNSEGDDMDGPICVSDGEEEVRGTTGRSPTQGPTPTSRHSFFSDSEDSIADNVEALSGSEMGPCANDQSETLPSTVVTPPVEQESVAPYDATEPFTLESDEVATELEDMFGSFAVDGFPKRRGSKDSNASLRSLTSENPMAAVPSNGPTSSRHINWRQSRVMSVCNSNLLGEAMAKVALGDQAMHPGRAKSGFSLFQRMKNLLENQDFDDSAGEKVIENIFFDSIPKKFVEIRSIEQVLRIDLLKRFLKKVSDESGSIECTFHGTQEKYVQDILDIGLCPNLCATGAYGRGAYVGTHAGVAHQYADPNAEGWRHMCVVLVLVGQKVVKGKEGEQCPATALDSLANPTQYCFVDEDRLYISHLITYRVIAAAAKRTGGGWDDPFQRKLTTAVSKAAKLRNKSGRR